MHLHAICFVALNNFFFLKRNTIFLTNLDNTNVSLGVYLKFALTHSLKVFENFRPSSGVLLQQGLFLTCLAGKAIMLLRSVVFIQKYRR